MENNQKMSTIDALYQIKFNSFKYAPYLASFYNSRISKKKNNLLFAPLILPLCEHSYFMTGKNIYASSTLNTIFGDYRNRIPDLTERIVFFRDITFNGINYCLVNDVLRVCTESLTLEYLKNKQIDFPINKKIQMMGEKLFSKYSIDDIYSFFGVDCYEIFYS